MSFLSYPLSAGELSLGSEFGRQQIFGEVIQRERLPNPLHLSYSVEVSVDHSTSWQPYLLPNRGLSSFDLTP